MGLFGALGSLVNLGLDVVTTPISIVKDSLTFGGELTDQDESYTGRKFDDIADDFDDIKRNLRDL